jgi:hypothetical protein
MSLAPPALIAVIGPVEPPLLTAWIRHYRNLGIEQFYLAFHFSDHVSDSQRYDLVASCRESDISPAAVHRGPWHEHTNAELRDALRQQAGGGWHLFADSDEFQHYPASIPEILATAEASGRSVVGGVLLDRVSPDGHLTTWREEIGLDRSFPLGGHLTHRLLRGDPRKIVLARSCVAVASGNHRAPGHKPDLNILVCVHHFKWRSGVLEDLRRRVEKFSSGVWVERTTAVRNEAAHLLRHVATYDGQINVADPRLGFRPVTLDHLLDSWTSEARQITSGWAPPTRQPSVIEPID